MKKGDRQAPLMGHKITKNQLNKQIIDFLSEFFFVLYITSCWSFVIYLILAR